MSDLITPPPVPATPANSWNIALHLSGFAGLVFPFGNIIAPLIIWLIKRAESPEIDATGKEVLNFQISFAIYAVVASLLCFLLIGFALLPIVGIAWLILIVIAAIKTSNGEPYKYPLTIAFLR